MGGRIVKRGAAALLSLAVLAGCSDDQGTPYAPHVRTYCSNATPPPANSADLAAYAKAAARTAAERLEGLQSRPAPADRRAAVERLHEDYSRLAERYETITAGGPAAGDARALRAAERKVQAQAAAAGLPECGPLARAP